MFSDINVFNDRNVFNDINVFSDINISKDIHFFNKMNVFNDIKYFQLHKFLVLEFESHLLHYIILYFISIVNSDKLHCNVLGHMTSLLYRN